MNKQDIELKLQANPFALLSDIICDLLRDEIVQMHLQPGTKLNVSQIALSLDVSRSPVEMAANKLISEGLIQKSNSSKHLIVAIIDKTKLQSLYEARVGIEGYAAFLAAKRINVNELKQLELISSQYADLAYGTNINNQAEFDHLFHTTIVKASRSELLIEMYQHIQSRIVQYRNYLNVIQNIEELRLTLSRASRYHWAVYYAMKQNMSSVAKEEIEQDIRCMIDHLGGLQFPLHEDIEL